MNLGEKRSARMVFKQEHVDDGSSADEQVISDMQYEEEPLDDSGEKTMSSVEMVDDEHEEIVLQSNPQVQQQTVVVTRTPMLPTTTTIKKITVTPVSSSVFAGRKEYKVSPAGTKANPIIVTQKMLQSPRTVTVVPKSDSTFKFTHVQGQTTIKRKLDTTSSPMVVKLPVDLKRFKPVPARTLGNFVLQQKDSVTGMPKIVRLVRNNKVERGTQTEVSGELLEQYEVLHNENQLKIVQLEEQMRKCKYTPEMFENDDKRTEYFTGLDSYVTMITLYNTCEAELPQSTALTKFEIFILTLLKLRLKLPLTFLSYQFCISPKAASFYFNECLNVLHKSLRELFAEPNDGSDGNIEIVADEN